GRANRSVQETTTIRALHDIPPDRSGVSLPEAEYVSVLTGIPRGTASRAPAVGRSAACALGARFSTARARPADPPTRLRLRAGQRAGSASQARQNARVGLD